ncbi:MAG TPA: hypothetical protein VG652_05270 [Gaiellaceae bacterium]|nr:hypothetical protein [Gaiellaceae bacterium]
MRRFFLIGVVLLLVFPATAFAGASSIGDGSLAVSNANVKSIVVVGHGLIYGYVDRGAVTVISYTPDDSNQFQISGAATPTKPATGGTRYVGSALRFLISGTYTLKFEGWGINLSAVGKGTAMANGADPLTSPTDGTLSVNGGKLQSLSSTQTLAAFGSSTH